MDAMVTSGKKNPTSGDSGTLAQEIMSEYAPTINKINQMLPTPAANDLKNATFPESQNKRDGLPVALSKYQHGKTFQLNPRFVLEMMGFPPDWTELPFLNGETNQ